MTTLIETGYTITMLELLGKKLEEEATAEKALSARTKTQLRILFHKTNAEKIVQNLFENWKKLSQEIEELREEYPEQQTTAGQMYATAMNIFRMTSPEIGTLQKYILTQRWEAVAEKAKYLQIIAQSLKKTIHTYQIKTVTVAI